jgi:ABC-2 type transport system permease protein
MIGWTEVLAFSTYPLFLVSGYSWPIDAMPIGLQMFANLLPSTPYFSVFNSLATEGAKLDNITNGFSHLLVLFLVGYLLLYVRFRFIKQKKITVAKNA